MRSGQFLSPSRFCHRKGISHTRLLELDRCGEVFSVVIDHRRYFPAVLADGSLNRPRLRRLLGRLPYGMPPIAKYFFLIGRRGSLADKSPLQATRRAKRYRIALRIADAEADLVRLQTALNAGENSGVASRFDGPAFLLRMRATRAR